eukprot:COSAG06_NODE_28579_length_571_cov_59.540254_1_plen_65_part_00
MPPLPLLLLLLLLPATTLSSERAVTLETPQRVGFRTPEASDRYGNGSNRGSASSAFGAASIVSV